MNLTERAADAWQDSRTATARRRLAEQAEWEQQDRRDRERRAPLIEAWFSAELGCHISVDPDDLTWSRAGHQADITVDGLTFAVRIGGDNDEILVTFAGQSIRTIGDNTALARLGEILATPGCPQWGVQPAGYFDGQTTTV